jgi:hypothetical protein
MHRGPGFGGVSLAFGVDISLVDKAPGQTNHLPESSDSRPSTAMWKEL